MFIINPLNGQGMDNLFSTHPATENRIAALDELAREMQQGGADLGGELPSRGGDESGEPGPWSDDTPTRPGSGPSGPWG